MFSGNRNIIFPDNTRKVIFQRKVFWKTMFSGRLEKENMVFRAVLIFFASKWRAKNICKINIKYNDINKKQHSEVTYLGCMLKETMSGEPKALKVINKISSKLKFLTLELRLMPWIVLIEPHDYAWPTWYPNPIKKRKFKIKTMQNKGIRFLQRLDKMHYTSEKNCGYIN